MSIPKLLTVKQLSEITGFAPRTLYDWVYDKKIPHYRVNGNIRFEEEKVKRWLNRQEVNPI